MVDPSFYQGIRTLKDVGNIAFTILSSTSPLSEILPYHGLTSELFGNSWGI